MFSNWQRLIPNWQRLIPWMTITIWCLLFYRTCVQGAEPSFVVLGNTSTVAGPSFGVFPSSTTLIGQHSYAHVEQYVCNGGTAWVFVGVKRSRPVTATDCWCEVDELPGMDRGIYRAYRDDRGKAMLHCVAAAVPGVTVVHPFLAGVTPVCTPGTVALIAAGVSTPLPDGIVTGHIVTPAVPAVRRGVISYPCVTG